MTAGARLRAELDAALARAGREAGQTLSWTEQESDVIGRAVSSADRAEVLARHVDLAEGKGDTGLLVKLSAELRMLDRQVVDLVARVNPGLGPAKSARHQRAARSRWDSKRVQGG